MKVITICGSMKFNRQMRVIARNLEAKNGWAVIQCIYSRKHDKMDNVEEMHNIENAHLKKIELCDAIYVVNIDGYIGAATKRAIAYAKKKGKEIIYHEPVDKTSVSKKVTKSQNAAQR